MHTALIVVDGQVDFAEGGALAVEGGAAALASVATAVAADPGRYSLLVATRDWHVDPGSHFSATPDFEDTWPTHCVAGTPGAELHPALSTVPFDVVVDKGRYAAAYSGFDGYDAAGRPLAAILRSHGIRRVELAGIAVEKCVKATAFDALAEGLQVAVCTPLVAGLQPATTAAALDELRAAGVELLGAPPRPGRPAGKLSEPALHHTAGR